MSLGLRIKGYWHEWHVGEPVPKELGRVVQIQADGDELDLILDAMAAARHGDSFLVKQPEVKRKKIYRIWYTPAEEDGATNCSATSTIVARRTLRAAKGWIEANPARNGTWSIREEYHDPKN